MLMRLDLSAPIANKNFKKSKMAATAVLKIRTIAILHNKTIDFDDI